MATLVTHSDVNVPAMESHKASGDCANRPGNTLENTSAEGQGSKPEATKSAAT